VSVRFKRTAVAEAIRHLHFTNTASSPPHYFSTAWRSAGYLWLPEVNLSAGREIPTERENPSAFILKGLRTARHML
jgi:hypothetical protein